jgi:hypothetical protein
MASPSSERIETPGATKSPLPSATGVTYIVDDFDDDEGGCSGWTWSAKHEPVPRYLLLGASRMRRRGAGRRI